MPTFRIPDMGTIQHQLELRSQHALKRYHKMSRRSKITMWTVFMINGVIMAAFFIIGPKRIGHWFNNLADGLKGMGFGGVLLISLCVVLSSHPPMFGFSACMSLIGFAYGLWWGVVLGTVASLIGASVAWFSIRHFFLEWMRNFGSSKNKQWEAFGHVMRDKGWPLVAMIRWCPLPWAIGNGLFASIDGVEYSHFMLANVLFIPRLAIPVFIGSRLSSLSDDTDTKPDPLRFWLNLGSIVLSIGLSIGTGTVIYKQTLRQMRRMEGHPGHLNEGELAAEAFESTALLGDFTDSEVEEELVPRTLSQSQSQV